MSLAGPSPSVHTSPEKMANSQETSHDALHEEVQRSTASRVTVASTRVLYADRSAKRTSSTDAPQSAFVTSREAPSSGITTTPVAADTTTTTTTTTTSSSSAGDASQQLPLSPSSSPQTLQVIADLKSELFHTSRQLTLARQQVQTHEETCTELRQRCQGLEVETQTLTLQLQDAQDRLQVRQTRLDEHRRSAAAAALSVVSLTAERDELAVKVQEAWDRVAELSAQLRRRDEDVARLQAEASEARHTTELMNQQRTSVEAQLQVLQAQVRADGADAQAQVTARERLKGALQEAVQRLAGLLGDVAYDYQQSIAEDREEGSEALMMDREMPPFRIASRVDRKEASDALFKGSRTDEEGTHTNNNNNNNSADDERSSAHPPHVVLSPAYHRPSATASRSTSPEAARLHAESLLHNAEAFLWGDRWHDGDHQGRGSGPATDLFEFSSQPSASPQEQRNASEPAQEQQGSLSEAVTAATPPPPQQDRRHTPSITPSAVPHSVPQGHQAISVLHAADPSAQDANLALSEQAFVRAALAPLLSAMKHVAAMLSTVRHEQRRTAAVAAHFRHRYDDAQRQLEVLQQSSQVQAAEAADGRNEVRRLQQELTHTLEVLAECRRDDKTRRAALATALQCREDWALIQHSVARLLGREAELVKDVLHLRQRPPPVGRALGDDATLSREGRALTLHDLEGAPKNLTTTAQEASGGANWEGQARTKEKVKIETTAPSVTNNVDSAKVDDGTVEATTASTQADVVDASMTFNSANEDSSFQNESPVPPLSSSSLVERTPHAQLLRRSERAATADTNGSRSAETTRAARPTVASAEDAQSSTPHASSPALNTTSSVRSNNTAQSKEKGTHQEVSLLSRQSVSRTYPAPQPQASRLTSSPSSLPLRHATENALLHAALVNERHMRYTQATESHPPSVPPPLPLSPSPTTTTTATTATTTSTTVRTSPMQPLWTGGDGHVHLPADGTRFSQSNINSSSRGGGFSDESSSMFAAEVLQVIEALDRRVSGALHRTPR